MFPGAQGKTFVYLVLLSPGTQDYYWYIFQGRVALHVFQYLVTAYIREHEVQED